VGDAGVNGRERVLVIDDDADVALLARMRLEMAGFTVDAVSYTHLTLPTICSV